MGRGEWSASLHSHFNPGESTSRSHQMNIQANEVCLIHMIFWELTLILSSISMFYHLLTYKHQWGYNESLSHTFGTTAHRINSANVCSGHKHIFKSLTLLVNSLSPRRHRIQVQTLKWVRGHRSLWQWMTLQETHTAGGVRAVRHCSLSMDSVSINCQVVGVSQHSFFFLWCWVKFETFVMRGQNSVSGSIGGRPPRNSC